VVVCLERGADLHVAQLMPLPLTFWYRLTRLVPEKGPLNGRVPICSQESCCTVQKSHNLTYAEEDVMFFEHQLDLFGKLAYVSHVYVHLCIDVKNVEIK